MARLMHSDLTRVIMTDSKMDSLMVKDWRMDSNWVRVKATKMDCHSVIEMHSAIEMATMTDSRKEMGMGKEIH